MWAEHVSVSVIIPHYQDVKALELCLAALERQTFDRDRFEVIVCDNASPIGEDAVQAAAGGRAKVITVHQRGAGPARNGGVAVSSGEVLAFIDSDCVPAPEWLSAGIDALARFDIVGGQVAVSVEDAEKVTPTEAFERVFAFNFKHYIERKGFTGSGNLFVPRAIFDKIGGFKTGVSEDVEWSNRASALGYRIGYAERALVFHPGRRSWSELQAKWRRVNLETYTLHRANGRGRLRWLVRSLMLPGSAILHAPRALLSPRLRSQRERLGAVATLFRLRLWRFGDSLRLLLRS